MTRYRTSWRIGCLLALLALTSSACGSSPTGPSGLFGGTWTGDVTDSVSGKGTGRLVLTQTESGLNGTFAWSFATGERSGSASGRVDGTTATMFLTPSVPVVCSPTVTLTGALAATIVVSGARMNASYFAFGCGSDVLTGTFELTRQ